ncbi:MAG: sulfite exporter TauE/SafE family protein [Clostridiales bacterium]|nr:sulfite exporter TauE/SafE family protein [Clostridiales bacterium]HBM81268.1 sulfite exporter TauE/SafE family protein [Clostridiaceae bacterium]
MLIFIVSILSGIISGMGIGGGTILIPVLILTSGISQQIAQSVNLISFIPTASIALITHIKNGNIEKKLLFKLIAAGILGAVLGSILASYISSAILRKMFAIFLFCIGVYEICCKKK